MYSDAFTFNAVPSAGDVAECCHVGFVEGLKDIERPMSSDVVNRYQEESLELNFLLQSERTLAKVLDMKHACAPQPCQACLGGGTVLEKARKQGLRNL